MILFFTNTTQTFSFQATQLKQELTNITLNSERPLTAAHSYSNIADGVNAANELVDNSNQAAINATELVSTGNRRTTHMNPKTLNFFLNNLEYGH